MLLFAFSMGKVEYNATFQYDGYELLCQDTFDDEYTIMINAGYISLNYSIAQNCIVGMSGVCPKSEFLRCSFDLLPFDLAQTGKVYLLDVESLTAGQGCQLPYRLRPMLDEKQGVLSFQYHRLANKALTHIACSNSFIISMNDGKIAAVWLKLLRDSI